MYSKILKIIGSVVLSFLLFVLPALVFSAPIDGTVNESIVGRDVNDGQARGTVFGITYECNHLDKDGKTPLPGECNFQDLVQALLHLVNWATGFALAFSIFVISYAGWNYMISGDNPGKRKDANEMLRKVAVGIALIVGAWVIVKLITSALGVNTGISTLG